MNGNQLIKQHTLNFLLGERACGGITEVNSHNGLVRAE